MVTDGKVPGCGGAVVGAALVLLRDICAHDTLESARSVDITKIFIELRHAIDAEDDGSAVKEALSNTLTLVSAFLSMETDDDFVAFKEIISPMLSGLPHEFKENQ